MNSSSSCSSDSDEESVLNSSSSTYDSDNFPVSDSVSNSSDSDTKEPECSPIVDEKMGAFLSSTPPVIEKILINMKAQDLNQCAKVCKMWSHIAQIIKRKRRSPLFMFQVSIDDKRHSRHVSTVDRQFDPEAHKEYVCKRPLELLFRFSNALKNSSIEPHLGILFSCKFLFDNNDKSLRKRITDEVKWITKYLPKNSSFICLATQGVIGTPISRIWPFEVEKSAAISGVFFPKNLPGIKFHHFEMPLRVKQKRSSDGKTRAKSALTSEEVHEITKIPQDTEIKCLLLLVSEFPQGYIRSLTRGVIDFMLKKNKTMAFGGGVADVVDYKKTENTRTKFCAVGTAIAITGNIEAASIIVPPEIQTERQVLEKLQDLKNGINFRENTLGFLFACCARGSEIFGEPNVESNCFRRVFPGIKLVGMFGNGEFGINYLPNKPTNSTTDAKKDVSYTHCFTSIFVILTWNDS